MALPASADDELTDVPVQRARGESRSQALVEVRVPAEHDLGSSPCRRFQKSRNLALTCVPFIFEANRGVCQ